jgi:arabinose-5-phosphate isomerase
MNETGLSLSLAEDIEHRRPSAVAAHALAINAASISLLASRVGEAFDRAIELILTAEQRVVISGLGKSGIVARKISATMASLGTPSLFVHSADAAHGDLGMIRSGDIAVLISASGETQEVSGLIPYLKRIGVPIIAITGDMRSTLARHADVVLDASVEREACPHNLAPTTSTLVTMALGDALAIALSTARDFKPTDFAKFHPGGKLGKRLTTQVRHAMHRDVLPIAPPETSLRALLPIMSAGKLGLVLIMDQGALLGIVTDGDLRRGFERADTLEALGARDIMTPDPLTIGPDVSLFDADQLMREARITALVVVDPAAKVLGVIQIHD